MVVHRTISRISFIYLIRLLVVSHRLKKLLINFSEIWFVLSVIFAGLASYFFIHTKLYAHYEKTLSPIEITALVFLPASVWTFICLIVYLKKDQRQFLKVFDWHEWVKQSAMAAVMMVISIGMEYAVERTAIGVYMMWMMAGAVVCFSEAIRPPFHYGFFNFLLGTILGLSYEVWGISYPTFLILGACVVLNTFKNWLDAGRPEPGGIEYELESLLVQH